MHKVLIVHIVLLYIYYYMISCNVMSVTIFPCYKPFCVPGSLSSVFRVLSFFPVEYLSMKHSEENLVKHQHNSWFSLNFPRHLVYYIEPIGHFLYNCSFSSTSIYIIELINKVTVIVSFYLTTFLHCTI